MKKSCELLITALGIAYAGMASAAVAVDRSKLPIAEPKRATSKIEDIRNAPKGEAAFQVKAPDGAPNVLIVLIDDMGFGQSSAFGGPINMPTAEKLANDGLRYNQFHTTALSSPTRAALLSGRNHHTNNMGSITETATSTPGNTGQRPESVAPLAKILRYNGYATAHIGKNHETPAWEISNSGPTDRWPTRNGFDKFYGFFGGETNQYSPAVYDGMTKIDIQPNPDYHFMTDMTNQAITWVQSVKSLTPEKPFFMYFAPGATHAPHQVPKAWIDKYKGKFDQGWDKLREETLARQIALGVVPKGTQLAPKPEGIRDWDTLSADEKKLFARQMEVFAGYGEYADTEVGRLVDTLEDLGELDNTLVFYVIGDNGASAEGTANGMVSEMTYFNGVKESLQDIMKRYDNLGDPTTYSHYASGWAVAGDTPFTWTKQTTSYGGTRNGMVVHWPQGVKAKNQVRSQWHHVIDVAPTILEAAKLPQPTVVDGVKQTPIEGVSMAYSFDKPKAQERHLTQYFEVFGNRSIYHQGWLAVTIHRAPWEFKPRSSLANSVWELYDTRTDFSLRNNLAQQYPAKLKEMKALFLKEAEKYHVLPMDDRSVERVNPAIAGRPDLMAGRTSLTVYPGMRGMSENVFINIKNTSHRITAELDIPKNGAEGVVLSQAGRFGGWSLYLQDGKPVYSYNFLGLERYHVTAAEALPAGKVSLVFDFAYDGEGMGKGGLGSLLVNGKLVGQGRIERTQSMIFSADEGADVGMDEETPVVDTYALPYPYRFTGRIKQITIDTKPASAL